MMSCRAWAWFVAMTGCYGPIGSPGNPAPAPAPAPAPPAPPPTLGNDEPDCIRIYDPQIVEQPPTALSVSLQVIECDTCDGIAPLNARDFQVINDETGLEFDARDEGVVAFAPGPPIDVYASTVLALDLSESIFADNRQDLVFDIAEIVADELLASNQGQVQHFISLYPFGAPSLSGPPTDFSADRAVVLGELATLRAQAIDSLGTTDLYHAHQNTLRWVVDRDLGEKFARRYVVLISDGTHEAGNVEALEASSLYLRESYRNEADVYAVTIPSNALAEQALCALPDERRFCLDADPAIVRSVFDGVAERLRWLQNSRYGFGICTPVALGNPTLTIAVQSPTAADRITRPYNTAELDGTIQNCDPADWLPSNRPVWPP